MFLLYLPRYETVNINLKNKPDWFFEKSPFGLVPVLETSKGQLIYESPITCEYLDEAYPRKKLYPTDPFEKASQKMLLEHFSKVCTVQIIWYSAEQDTQLGEKFGVGGLGSCEEPCR